MIPGDEGKVGTENAENIETAEITEVLSNANARRMIFGMINDMGYFNEVFDRDDHLNAYFSGRRGYAVELVDKLKEAAPDKFALMITENWTNAT